MNLNINFLSYSLETLKNETNYSGIYIPYLNFFYNQKNGKGIECILIEVKEYNDKNIKLELSGEKSSENPKGNAISIDINGDKLTREFKEISFLDCYPSYSGLKIGDAMIAISPDFNRVDIYADPISKGYLLSKNERLEISMKQLGECFLTESKLLN